MNRTGTMAPRAELDDVAEQIAEGLEDYARDAHARLMEQARRPLDPQALALAHLDYQRAELALARSRA